MSCGGKYPCVGCVCSVSRFADFSHVANCEIRTFNSVQEIALQGVYGKKAGYLKFYEALNKRELQLELEARIKEYPGSKNGRLDVLKEVQRVPSLLLFTPEVCLEDMSLQRYSVLPFEPLHDLKGYMGAILKKLTSVIPNGRLKDCVAAYLDSVWKKEHLYGSDLREALIEVAHLFVSSNVSIVGTSQQCTVGKYINCLVQISKILCSKDCHRTPKQCLQFYNYAFIVHQLHCDLFGETKTGLYFHALLGQI